MTTGLIFDSNKTSETVVKSFLSIAEVNVYTSFCYKVDVFAMTNERKPELIVIDFELYRDNIYGIIFRVKNSILNCKIIVIGNKISKGSKIRLLKGGVDFVYTKPLIDAVFIRDVRKLSFD